MKHRRFIELVNLYIDQEATPDEVAELEDEIVSNSSRRRIYRNYCRIHRATQIIFEQFRSEAPAGRSPRVTQPIPRTWVRTLAGASAVAAVLMAALIITRPETQTGGSPDLVAQAPSAVETRATTMVVAENRADATSSNGGALVNAEPVSIVIVPDRDWNGLRLENRWAPLPFAPDSVREEIWFGESSFHPDRRRVSAPRYRGSYQPELTTFSFSR